ncbi:MULTISPECIES: PIN domain-containing protein [unclassified Shinella]|uniref:PIN domain-containing protein n=1 Tax=unclassified Shinella TaxID=2643062 RepID=UPI000AAFCE2F|nr:MULTISPECIES: PIN domain-containing protein [unclassified Shinella]
MTKIYDASKGVAFNKRKILFDTNIWIAIDGNDPRPHHINYSNLFGEILKSDNELVTNDYVISEYFNRACKIQYDIKYATETDRGKRYKSRRKAGALNAYMSAVRDICIDILTDCTFESAVTAQCPIPKHIKEAALGDLDLSDIIIREHCARSGYILVSDDGDFSTCGLELVTANPAVIRGARKAGTLVNG